MLKLNNIPCANNKKVHKKVLSIEKKTIFDP